MYIGLSIVSVYLLLLPYFPANKDYQSVHEDIVVHYANKDVTTAFSYSAAATRQTDTAAAAALIWPCA